MKEEDAELGMLALEKGFITQDALNEVITVLAEGGTKSIIDLFQERSLLKPDQLATLKAEADRRVQGRRDPVVAPADPTERETVVLRAPKPAAPPPEETASTAATAVPPKPPPSEASKAAENKANLFGDFILVQEVGKGTRMSVWKAWDLKRGVWAALKFMKDAWTNVDGANKMLEAAKEASGLAHPGIAAVLDAGWQKRGTADEAYIAQEFVEGESLDLVRARGLDLKRAAEIIRDAAQAASYAHSRGAVHRDIKPRNLMLGMDGKVRLTDFGLAHLAATLAPDDDNNLSRVVQVMGTPSYLPPEQALGRTSDIDERSDVYALGATLYFLVTGKPPFDGNTPMKICFAVVQDELVPPSRHAPAAKGDLEKVILRAMAKDPVQRYESANAMATDLDHYVQGIPIVSDDQRRYAQGLRALEAGRLEEAIHMFKELIRLETTSQDGAVIGYQRVLAEIKSGEEGLTLAIAQQGKNYHIRTQRGILRFARAIIMSLEGSDPSASCKEALDDFVQATALRNESPASRVNRANVMIFGGRYARDSGKDVSTIFEMAMKDLDAALQFDPTSSHAYHNRGIVNFYIARATKKGAGDPEPSYRKAIEDFSRGAELEPTYAYIFKDLGVAKVSLAKHLLSRGEKVKNLFVEAVHHLDMACKQNSLIYGAFYERGQAHFALKDFKAAIRDFKRCLELDPAREGKIQALIDEAQKHLDTRKY